ncbi:MAG: GMC family oxidoreductase, partial [Candidatus Kariarchaeaceae archaeon]
MLIDSRTIPKNKIIETDVCIIGAGAAGITIAREFIGQNFQVCLMESGGFEYDEYTQSSYEGINVGQDYDIKGSRLRYFGGTTNHWAGFCRPIDEIDFEKRDWIPNSGWPFKKSDLDNYYKRAHKICQIGPYNYQVKDWESKDYPTLLFNKDTVISKFFQLSPPTRFGKVYRDEIINTENIDTYLYANAVDIESNYNAKTVKSVRFSTLENNIFWISAKFFIIASGGIENARLLLSSDKVQKNGLGNQNDLVGRYFMEHLEIIAALFLPSNPVLSGFYKTHKIKNNIAKGTIIGVLSLSDKTRQKEKLLNLTSELKGISINEYKDEFLSHISNVINEVDFMIDKSNISNNYNISEQRYIYRLTSSSEQVPNPSSRVTLSTKRDRFNMRRIKLNWQLTEFDRHSLLRSYQIIGQEF